MKFITKVLSLVLLRSYVQTRENVLLILGGVPKVFLSQYNKSPILNNFELFGCPDDAPSLPPYPLPVFGASLVWNSAHTVWACGGANWKEPIGDCYTWDTRTPSVWTKQASLNKKRAYGILAYMPDYDNKIRLFMIGGLDPITYSHVLAVEYYDDAEDAWKLHRDLPDLEDLRFPFSPDSGCITVVDGKVFTVGEELSYLGWNSWEVVKFTDWKGKVNREHCSYHNRKEEEGFFFLSGHWYSLKTKSWSTFARPASAFSLVSYDQLPTLLGMAHQNGTCSKEGCDGNTLYGDRAVYQLDMEQDSWAEVGQMEQERVSYTSAVQVPHSVCDRLRPDLQPETNKRVPLEEDQEAKTMDQTENGPETTKTPNEEKLLNIYNVPLINSDEDSDAVPDFELKVEPELDVGVEDVDHLLNSITTKLSTMESTKIIQTTSYKTNPNSVASSTNLCSTATKTTTTPTTATKTTTPTTASTTTTAISTTAKTKTMTTATTTRTTKTTMTTPVPSTTSTTATATQMLTQPPQLHPKSSAPISTLVVHVLLIIILAMQNN